MTVTVEQGSYIRVKLANTAGVVATHIVQVDKVVRLNCGCDRLEAERPGPRPTPIGGVHFYFGRCDHGEESLTLTQEDVDGGMWVRKSGGRFVVDSHRRYYLTEPTTKKAARAWIAEAMAFQAAQWASVHAHEHAGALRRGWRDLVEGDRWAYAPGEISGRMAPVLTMTHRVDAGESAALIYNGEPLPGGDPFVLLCNDMPVWVFPRVREHAQTN